MGKDSRTYPWKVKGDYQLEHLLDYDLTSNLSKLNIDLLMLANVLILAVVVG